MAALTITILVSFIFGGLSQLAWHRAFRTFNAATLGGAVLATLAAMLAFAFSLFMVARIGILLGTYNRPNDTVVLGSFAAGFIILHVIGRIRGGRQR